MIYNIYYTDKTNNSASPNSRQQRHDGNLFKPIQSAEKPKKMRKKTILYIVPSIYLNTIIIINQQVLLLLIPGGIAIRYVCWLVGSSVRICPTVAGGCRAGLC